MANIWLGRIIIAFTQDEERSFEQIYEDLKGPLYTFICNIIRNHEEAEEIAIDIFLKVLEELKSGKFNNLKHLKNWLYKTARHACYDHLKNRKTQKENLPTVDLQDRPENIADPDLQPDILEAETHWQFRLDSIMQQIDQLSPQQQTVFRLRYQENRTFDEIAVIMGIKTDTVKKYHKTGKRTIKKATLLRGLLIVLIILCIQLLSS